MYIKNLLIFKGAIGLRDCVNCFHGIETSTSGEKETVIMGNLNCQTPRQTLKF